MIYKKVYCKDCDILLSDFACYHKTTRCTSCSRKNQFKYKKNHPMYGKHISLAVRKRHSILMKKKYINPKNHPRYIDGRYIIKHFCIDCKKTLGGISNKRCRSCSTKYRFKNKNNNPFYGKKHSLVTRKKWSLLRGGTGMPYENTEYGSAFDSALKERVRFRDKYKCQECGCTQLENGRQLDVHHIDYNKKNNVITNLISLCLSCHAKTNFNRKSWNINFNKLILKICHY